MLIYLNMLYQNYEYIHIIINHGLYEFLNIIGIYLETNKLFELLERSNNIDFFDSKFELFLKENELSHFMKQIIFQIICKNLSLEHAIKYKNILKNVSLSRITIYEIIRIGKFEFDIFFNINDSYIVNHVIDFGVMHKRIDILKRINYDRIKIINLLKISINNKYNDGIEYGIQLLCTLIDKTAYFDGLYEDDKYMIYRLAYINNYKLFPNSYLDSIINTYMKDDIYIICENGNLKLFNQLIKTITYNSLDIGHMLTLVCKTKNVDFIKRILELKSVINSYNLIQDLVYTDNLQIAIFLKNMKIINKKDILMACAYYNSSNEIFKYFINYIDDNKDIIDIFEAACINDNIIIVKYLYNKITITMTLNNILYKTYKNRSYNVFYWLIKQLSIDDQNFNK